MIKSRTGILTITLITISLGMGSIFAKEGSKIFQKLSPLGELLFASDLSGDSIEEQKNREVSELSVNENEQDEAEPEIEEAAVAETKVDSTEPVSSGVTDSKAQRDFSSNIGNRQGLPNQSSGGFSQTSGYSMSGSSTNSFGNHQFPSSTGSVGSETSTTTGNGGTLRDADDDQLSDAAEDDQPTDSDSSADVIPGDDNSPGDDHNSGDDDSENHNPGEPNHPDDDDDSVDDTGSHDDHDNDGNHDSEDHDSSDHDQDDSFSSTNSQITIQRSYTRQKTRNRFRSRTYRGRAGRN
ncbi:MAG: hypothetical protein R3C11_22030 [Planctomycetaceae bacterium]